VAGTGTRLRPHTLTVPKVLLPVAGKPMLQYIIDELIPYQIDEYIFIIGHLGEHIKEFITKTYPIKSRFIEQNQRLGLGHAVYLAKEYIEPGDDMLVILGDTIFELDLKAIIEGDRSLIGVKEVADPSRFGVVQLKEGTITRFIEKPATRLSNLAIVGIYYMRNAETLMNALAYLMEQEVKTEGEYQLTDALQHMLEEGTSFGVIPVHGWFDCGKPETLLATNRHLLKKHFSDTKSRKAGITPPCYIGKSVTLRRAIVGPHVSIGDGCTIQNSAISNTIVYNNARISNACIKDSIVGAHATINGGSLILNIGEYASVEDQGSQNAS
jgi:glucose-1-phosphate thymidylyltransferase